MKDIDSNYLVIKEIAPIAVSDTTAITGDTIDLQAAGAVEFLLSSGSLADADATFAVVMQEGALSNMSDAATVAAADTIGTVPAITFADDNKVWQFGYKGSKRYVRIVVTPTGNASAANFSAVALVEKKKA